MGTQIIPQYNRNTDTYTVDWPGRPAGPLPTFKTYTAARQFAQLQRIRIPCQTQTNPEGET